MMAKVRRGGITISGPGYLGFLSAKELVIQRIVVSVPSWSVSSTSLYV